MNLNVRALLVAIGGSFMLFSSAIDYSYGNLNTYVISYLKARVDDRYTYADFIFISQGKVLVGAIFSPFGGHITDRLGLRTCLLIASLVYSLGYMITFFTLDLGLWPTVFTVAVMHGFGYALLYPCSIAAVLKWYPERRQGFYTSIAVFGVGFGSVVWNPLVTGFVNPENISPVFNPEEGDSYFIDDQVLDRIPYLFLILGGCFLVCQALAILLQREPTSEEKAKILEMEERLELDINEKKIKQKSEEEIFQVEPKNVIKITHFWKIYSHYFSLTLLNVFINSYNKSFGQNFIKDDRFFATVGMATNLFNGSSRIVWGYIYDRIGFKSSMVILTSFATAIAFSFGNLAFLEQDSIGAKLFYAIWICSLFFFQPGSFSCYPPGMTKAFGAKYFSHHYGIIITSGIGYSILLIIVTKTLFDFLGYEGMFLICGFFGMIGLLMMLLYPDEINSEDFRSRFEKSSTNDLEKTEKKY